MSLTSLARRQEIKQTNKKIVKECSKMLSLRTETTEYRFKRVGTNAYETQIRVRSWLARKARLTGPLIDSFLTPLQPSRCTRAA